MDDQKEDEVVKHGKQIQIPVGAAVSCTDGICGKSTHLLVNPTTRKMTHLVVRGSMLPHPEYVVPIESVEAASADVILLKCSQDELHHMKRFVQTEYVEVPMALGSYGGTYGAGTYLAWPYVVPEVMVRVPLEQEQFPPDELVVHRGTRVEARDGTAGYVDELLVDPGTGNVTHLVMREGVLWGQKDVAIPVSAIYTASDNTVELKLSKQEIAALPGIPIRRPPINIP